MPDPKKRRARSLTMRERANANLKRARRDGTIKDGSAGNMMGLLARLAAGAAKSAAKTAPKAAPKAAEKAAPRAALSQVRGTMHAATRGSGANKSSWVNRAQSGNLPTKVSGAAAGGAALSKPKPKKKMNKMTKPAPKRATRRRAKAY